MHIDLLTVHEMAEADRRTIAAGTPGLSLMERAGVAVADAAARRFPLATPGLVVCGPGNNGGDGFVAARVLAQRGYPVRMILAGDRARLKGDAAEAASRYRGEIEPPEAFGSVRADFIVDALFGAGLDRPVEGAAADLIARVNALRPAGRGGRRADRHRRRHRPGEGRRGAGGGDGDVLPAEARPPAAAGPHALRQGARRRHRHRR